VIAPDAVLTAGHCLGGGGGEGFTVVVGRADLHHHNVGERIDVIRGKADPNFILRGHHDVSVLRLEHATSVTPASLPTEAEAEAATTEGARLPMAGWGATTADGTGQTRELLEGETNVIASSECRDAFPHFWAPRTELCTRGDALPGGGYVSACYGDSGGPLMGDTPGGARLVGVTSYGGVRCGLHKPTTYARVGRALGFIRRAAGL
jgi:secreted trypsin-like serine protease